MKFQWLIVALLPAILIGCGGGGGGGGTPAVEYKMADVAAPKNAGTEGGFIYNMSQTVAVDITLPYQNGAVSIYDSRPLVSFDSSGAPVSTPSLLLAQGQATTNVGGVFHYTDSITISSAITSLYIVPMMGVYPSNSTIPITNGTASYTFAKGGAL